MTQKLCLQLADWPAIDQRRWQQAQHVVSFRTGPSPAAGWSPRRRRIVVQGYGQWLSHLARHGKLDADEAPELRATPERIEAFVNELAVRVAPWSVVMMVQGVQRMLAVMAPHFDWAWLALVVSNLKRMAKPSRDKRSHMVTPDQLYRLGLSLMHEAESKENPYSRATMSRDGLLICVLTCCPIRIANLTAMRLGIHLKFDRDSYLLSFGEDETKTGRSYQAELPPELAELIDRYLKIERQTLLAQGRGDPTDGLWISRWGTTMGEAAIRVQIENRTKHAFGKHVWPHLFRTIAATGFVDEAPDDAVMIADLLGHSDLKTSQKYYVLANAARAHKKVQAAIRRKREEARERLKLTGTGRGRG